MPLMGGIDNDVPPFPSSRGRSRSNSQFGGAAVETCPYGHTTNAVATILRVCSGALRRFPAKLRIAGLPVGDFTFAPYWLMIRALM